MEYRNYQVATTSDLASTGISRDAAERRVKVGAWQRPARAVYVQHGRALTPVELGHVASAYVGEPCAITGLAALHELECRWLPPLTGVVVRVPGSCRRPTSGRVRPLRTSRWDELAVWRWAGLSWVDADQAVVDAVRGLSSLRGARGVVLGAVADRRAGIDGLTEALARSQRNGSALMRRALLDAARGCASPPEAELVDQLIGRREPFLVNPEVWVGGVLLGQPDVWFVRRHVGGEVESSEFHEGEAQTESTYDRHERFGAAGVPLLHLSVRRIRDRPPTAGTWLLGRAAEEAVAAPAGLRIVPRGPLLR